MRWWALLLVATSAFACGGVEDIDGGPFADVGPPDVGDASMPLPKLPIDKVDILISLDNSRSMAQNQNSLAGAIPILVRGLVEGSLPVTRDLHIGIVTSSLGGGGAPDICQPDAKIQASEVPELAKFNRHNDDRGELVNRIKPDINNPPMSGIEDQVSDAKPSNFLAWLPAGGTSPVPPIKDAQKMIDDFQELARGVGSYGCGLEAQMESWYRFLAQPDPYDSIQLDTSQTPYAATLLGASATILKQRADFMRPDSLLVVLVVTDEEDSWTDPMWLAGRGWLTRAQNNTYSTTGQIPRGTVACDAPIDANNVANTGPNSPQCQWCAIKGTEGDPNCANNKGLYGPKEDGLNVRYTNDMKRRYGMDPQFPISRYVDGLKSDMVPDRQGEHYTPDNKLSSQYIGRKNCRNPIYAKKLTTDPNGELCKIERNGRTPDQVLFGLVGGVPWQLLTADPKNPQSPFKATLSSSDWVRIVGKDPAHYFYDGIDPHMIESIKPRAAIACGPGSPSNCDPIHGREFDTTSSKVGIDLQYACTFTLPVPLDCTKTPDAADCDCGGSYTGPLCDPNPNDNGNLTLQARGRAYPTIRELRVAQAVGESAVVGSICQVRAGDDDASYRSVFRALVDKSRAVIADHKK